MTAVNATLFPRAVPAGPALSPVATGPLLVATDGSAAADAALRAACLLVGRTNADVRVLSVVAPAVLPSPDGSTLPSPAGFDQARKAERLGTIREQVRRVAGDVGEEWIVEVRIGPPARTIAQLAREQGATMIVLGLGRHNVVDRFFSPETALEVVRLAGVPVLAVARGFTGLPRRAVVATDFGELSRRAARVTARIMRANATLYLVHARLPIDMPGGEWGSWAREYDASVDQAFELMRAGLDAPPDADVETVLLPGDPASRVLEFAESAPADLIAAGSHGHGFFARMVLGGVSTRLLRGARCSVLIVPPAAEE